MAIPNWLTLSTLNGSGDTVVTITADTYYDLVQRTSELVISGHTKSVRLPVTQSPSSMRVQPSRIVVGSAATTTNMYITSSYPWELVSGVSFGSLSQTTGGTGTTNVTFTTTENTTGNNRYGNLVFSDGEDSVTVSVTQYNDMQWDIEATYQFTSATQPIVAISGLLDDTFEVDGVLHSFEGEGLPQPSSGYVVMNLGVGTHTIRYNTVTAGDLGASVFEPVYFNGSYRMIPMTDVTINGTVKNIHYGAFGGCRELTSITLSEGIESMGQYDNWTHFDPFGSMTNRIFIAPKLTSVTLPSTLKFISGAFGECGSLTGLTIPSGCGVGVPFDMQYSSSFTISSFTYNVPNDAKMSSSYSNPAFKNYDTVATVEGGIQYIGPVVVGVADKTRTSYTVRNGTRAIKVDAFHNCTEMTGITMPSSYTAILGSSFFSGCTSLPVVSGITYVGDTAISCTGATNDLVFSAGTRIISCNARYNQNITGVTIPDGVEHVSLQQYLFRVRSLTIPSSVTYFRGYQNYPTDGGWSSLTSVTLYDTLEHCSIPNAKCEIKTSKLYINAPTGATYVTIPDGVEEISDFAFYSCRKTLTGVTIPNTVKSINYGAFYQCTALTSVSIPGSVKIVGGIAFDECTSLTSVTLHSGLEEISVAAFVDAPISALTLPNTLKVLDGLAGTQITSINIPNGVERIESECFSGCYNLRSLTIPPSVEYLGDFIVRDCTALTSVTMTHMPKVIGQGTLNLCGITSFTIPSDAEWMFDLSGCYSLREVTIPASVKLIEDFGHGCSALTTLYSYNIEAPNVFSGTFGNNLSYIASNGVLHHPAGTDYSSWMSTAQRYLGYYNWTHRDDL